MEKNLKIGFVLIILGEILYFLSMVFKNTTTDVGDFTNGIVLGLSVGINLIGIVLVVMSVSKKNK